MFYKLGLLRKFRWAFVIVGIISAVFGIVSYSTMPSEDPNFSMLMGMFTGMGSAFVVAGVIVIILNRKMTPEQLKQLEIEKKDERNTAIQGKALLVSNIVTALFFAVSAFVLVGLGNRTAAYLVLGGLYLQLFSIIFASRHYQKKM